MLSESLWQRVYIGEGENWDDIGLVWCIRIRRYGFVIRE